MKQALGIYLHIPFCLQKCLYCDFNSYSGMFGMRNEYTAALCREIEAFEDGFRADTVYFGGGTPSLMPLSDMELIMKALSKKFVIDAGAEITMECNPGTVTEESLRAFRQLGINRLSIGMQSSNDAELKKLGRIHSMNDTLRCVRDARKAGFSNISLDLMYGLPGQSAAAWERTLTEAIRLEPWHLSCYALKIEEGTPFAAMQISVPPDDTVRNMYDAAVNRLENAGYMRYEISNFAADGYESRHNLKYWKCDDFIGFGAGAYSCVRGRRFANEREISRYIKESALKERFSYCEKLSRNEMMSEFMFLGLRTKKGADLSEFEKRFGISAEEVFKAPLKKYTGMGLVCRDDTHVYLRDDMFFVSNAILADFLL